MAVEVNKDGTFSLTIGSDQLSKGLRPSWRLPRNNGYLTTCDGAVGRDGVLQVLDELTPIATATITDGFPYPQIFVFVNLIIVCGETKIYEWVAGALVEKLAVAAGSIWSAVDFREYVYMSNGAVSVVRNPLDKTYAVTTDLPIASAICNMNDQIIIGAPDAT